MVPSYKHSSPVFKPQVPAPPCLFAANSWHSYFREKITIISQNTQQASLFNHFPFLLSFRERKRVCLSRKLTLSLRSGSHFSPLLVFLTYAVNTLPCSCHSVSLWQLVNFHWHLKRLVFISSQTLKTHLLLLESLSSLSFHDTNLSFLPNIPALHTHLKCQYS